MPPHNRLRHSLWLVEDLNPVTSGHPTYTLSNLLEELNPFVNGLESLLSGLPSWLPNDHLGLQAIRLRDIELGLKADIDQRIVMLKIDAKAFGFESSPEDVLVHTIGLFGP